MSQKAISNCMSSERRTNSHTIPFRRELQGRGGRTKVLLKWKLGKVKANVILNCYKGKELFEASACEKSGSFLRELETQTNKKSEIVLLHHLFPPVLLLHAIY